MKLKFLQLDLIWSKEVSMEDLRVWVLNQICQLGEPVRWAITSVKFSEGDPCVRELIVEAVLIIS